MYQYDKQDIANNFQPGDNQNTIYNTNNHDIQIRFEQGSTSFLDLEGVRLQAFIINRIKNQSEIRIEGYTSDEKSKEQHYQLFIKRAQRIKKIILTQYPNIKVTAVYNDETIVNRQKTSTVKLNVIDQEHSQKDSEKIGNWFLCKETDEVIWWNRDDDWVDKKLKKWTKVGKVLDIDTAGGGLVAVGMLILYKKNVTKDDMPSMTYTSARPLTGVVKPSYTNNEIDAWGVYFPNANQERAADKPGDNYKNLYMPLSHENVYNKLTHATGMFYVDDDFPANHFFYMMLSSWIYGVGYENYFFGPNSKVSKQLAKSSFINRAVKAWQTKPQNHHNIDNSPSPTNAYNEFYKDGYKKYGTYKTVSHTIGGAHILYTYDETSNTLRMEIFNVMNVGSGTGANAEKKIDGYLKQYVISYLPFSEMVEELFVDKKEGIVELGRDAGYPRVEGLNITQPFTNISQTIIVEVQTQSELELEQERDNILLELKQKHDKSQKPYLEDLRDKKLQKIGNHHKKPSFGN